MIQRGQAASDMNGISALHAGVFQSVADAQGCVIACRSVGPYATGLIAESYSSKGFHNKAKSCDWGPMAGFVLSDPRFSKATNVQGQQGDIDKAKVKGALEVPLLISKDRLSWLMEKSLFRPTFIQAPELYRGMCHHGGLSIEFEVKRTVDNLYSVRFRKVATGLAKLWSDGSWEPVMALRDPHCTVPAHSHLSATTGDYDLFAVWAPTVTTVRATRYSPEGQDKRMVAHGALEANIKAGRDPGEDKNLGNITQRIAAVRIGLNRGFLLNGYLGGNMVHHSDEGGRPFAETIDLPVFAVVPGKTEPYGLTDPGDLKEFIATEISGHYAPVFNPGWMGELTGIARRPGLPNGRPTLKDQIIAHYIP